MWSRTAVAVTLVAAAVAVVPGPAPTARLVADAPATTAFAPITPCRLLDTRTAGSRPAASAVHTVAAVGQCDVPADATAVAFVVTAIDSSGSGFVAVWPSGLARPLAANLNVSAGNTRANGAVVQLGADGALHAMVNVASHLVIDVTGAFVPDADAQAAAGRFVPVTPVRLLDTRTEGGRLPPRSSRIVQLPAEVPADAVALAVNVATTASLGAGFFSAYPTGTARPLTSVLNTDTSGQTRSAGAIVPVNEDGFELYSHLGEHVILDITGYFTGPSAALSGEGLFVPMTPTRLVDTRDGGKSIFRKGTLILDPTPIVGSASAIVANWTSTKSTAVGFLSAYPAFTARPIVATTSVDHAGSTVAGLALNAVTEVGVAVYVHGGGHVVADVFGVFTGPPVETTESLAPLVSAASTEGRRVLMVGDSTLAGLRWYTSAHVALRGADFVLDAESCRRLADLSCVGREGRRPPTAVEAIIAHQGALDVVVIMTGYNDWYTAIPVAFDQVVAASRAKGATEVIWLTYRLDASYVNPTGSSTNESYQKANDILRAKVATGAFPDVRIADWSTYTAAADHWFGPDGVHLSVIGAHGVADFVSRHLAASEGRHCPAPWEPGGGIEDPCSSPDTRSPVVDVLGVYNTTSTDVYCYQIGSDRHIVCSIP